MRMRNLCQASNSMHYRQLYIMDQQWDPSSLRLGGVTATTDHMTISCA
jgi:hypothetical protein